MEKTLHITNGDAVTNRLDTLGVRGEKLTWREMCCEGPTELDLLSVRNIRKRKAFLSEAYGISGEDYQKFFVDQIKNFGNFHQFDEIVLWFEFDLFCHINMIAAISLLQKKEVTAPIYLVCSGRVSNEREMKGLAELTPKQFEQHYKKKVRLTEEDILLAKHVWTLYCEDDPARIANQIKTKSSFAYLSSCLRAHLQRYPNMKSGLNTMEQNILSLIDTHEIKNVKQLLGYALSYQGYYGYGDIQMKRVLDQLSFFYKKTRKGIVLTDKGKEALHKENNFYRDLVQPWSYGGSMKYDFLYNGETHKLLKL